MRQRLRDLAAVRGPVRLSPVDGVIETRRLEGECETDSVLTVIDVFTRESLAPIADGSPTGVKVAAPQALCCQPFEQRKGRAALK